MSGDKEKDRFTISDEEEASESLFIADAANLRIEKLSTKITLIAILIPCLLVIILVIAYLDIKNRVISTQTTGTMGVQNLSKDLESRFSSLSLKQAKMEAQFAEHLKNWETRSAALQVKLEKAATELERMGEEKADRKELQAAANQSAKAVAAMEKEMEGLHDQMKDLTAAFAKFDEDLASQILLIAEKFKKDQGRLSDVEQQTQRLETEKLSQDALKVRLNIEKLALQEMVKDRIGEVNKRLTNLDKKVDALARKQITQQSKAATPLQRTTPPNSIPPQKSSERSLEIEEQTIQ